MKLDGHACEARQGESEGDGAGRERCEEDEGQGRVRERWRSRLKVSYDGRVSVQTGRAGGRADGKRASTKKAEAVETIIEVDRGSERRQGCVCLLIHYPWRDQVSAELSSASERTLVSCAMRSSS